jgi:hypothetical protein
MSNFYMDKIFIKRLKKKAKFKIETNNLKSTSKYFVFFITLLSFIYLPRVNVNAASSNRYYAGYYYSGTQPSAPEGVKAKIYAKNTGIPPWFEFAAEWIDVRISYSMNYWVQTGYIIHWTWVIIPLVTVDFYIERMDYNGHGLWYLWWPGKPLFGHTYTYKLLLTDINEWSYYIYEGSTVLYSGIVNVDPYTPRDLLAFVETTHTDICISGSHIWDLRYLQSSTSWPLWNQHIRYTTSPYYLDSNNLDYEFYAYGGG